jgi:hypothetical protein
VTYWSFQPRSEAELAQEREEAPPEPTPTPAPTPPQVPDDPNPERTLIMESMNFFQSIAQKKFGEAAGMFESPEKQNQWETNLKRVEEVGNPIVAFEIEKFNERDYCRMESGSRTKARCDFPILLYRRDNDVREWASITVNFSFVDGRWRIAFYNQEALDKEAYDKRVADEDRRRQAAVEAREKLAEPPATGGP